VYRLSADGNIQFGGSTVRVSLDDGRSTRGLQELHNTERRVHVPRHIAVGANNEVYVTLTSVTREPGLVPGTTVIFPSGELRTSQSASLGIVSDADRRVYRIAELRRAGKLGFQVLPLVLQ
jgi:hypothetical protein